MSDPTNKVPFPHVGDGTAVLRYRTADLITLEQKYGLQFTSVMTERLTSGSHECLVECLRAGIKREDGRKPYAQIDYDDLPFAIWDAVPLILDAVSSAISGKSYAEILEARSGAEPDPQPSLEAEDSFSESSRPDMPQAS
jgi:hypothetical protein